MMFLQARVGIEELFPCQEAIDPSSRMQAALPLVGLLCDGIA